MVRPLSLSIVARLFDGGSPKVGIVPDPHHLAQDGRAIDPTIDLPRLFPIK
jgi:hypothetical protein